jgi:hypothetical protein
MTWLLSDVVVRGRCGSQTRQDRGVQVGALQAHADTIGKAARGYGFGGVDRDAA